MGHLRPGRSLCSRARPMAYLSERRSGVLDLREEPSTPVRSNDRGLEYRTATSAARAHSAPLWQCAATTPAVRLSVGDAVAGSRRSLRADCGPGLQGALGGGGL